MEDEKGQQQKKHLDILADIRKTASPGRRGGNSPYAQAMYDYYAEIVELQSEGFTMATICKYLESKGALPNDADEHSFRRAFRRETDRRKRIAKSQATKAREAEKKSARRSTENLSSVTTKAAQAPSSDAPVVVTESLLRQRRTPEEPTRGVQVNPDNTFVIQPPDPALVAAFEKKK